MEWDIQQTMFEGNGWEKLNYLHWLQSIQQINYCCVVDRKTHGSSRGFPIENAPLE